MDAQVGDRIVVESERVGQRDREGEILEVIPASTQPSSAAMSTGETRSSAFSICISTMR